MNSSMKEGSGIPLFQEQITITLDNVCEVQIPTFIAINDEELAPVTRFGQMTGYTISVLDQRPGRSQLSS